VLSALLGLIGAVVYGASDFFGGIAAKSMSAVRVTAINSGAGLVLLVLGSVVFPPRWSEGALLTGVLSGIAGAAALGLLYACLALGPMSILSPIMALVAAVIPIAVGFARGERLSIAGNVGLLIGLLAIILICFVPGAGALRPSARGIIMAVAAGVAIGAYLVIIDLSPTDSGPAPLIVCFAVTGLVMGAIVLLQSLRRGERPRASPGRPTVLFAILCGLTDAGAAFLFLLALRAGDLSVVSVLNALAPAGTIVLASLVLKERIAVVQWIGLAIALAAAALLALA
jgi:drug/metabolite transporter (DMT)-like permease